MTVVIDSQIKVRILHKGKSLVTTMDDPRAIKALNANKKYRPNICGLIEQSTALIFLDLDNVHSFSQTASPKDVNNLYPGQDTCFTTASGRYKKVVSIVLPEGTPLTLKIAQDTIRHYFPKLLKPDFGLDLAGCLTSFIDDKGLQAVHKALETEPLPAIITQHKLRYHRMNRRMSRFLQVKDEHFYYRFIGKLLASPQLGYSGLDIPVTFWAKDMEVNTSSVTRAKQQAEREGLLTCTDSWYCLGKKAKTYKATGRLLKAIQELHRIQPANQVNSPRNYPLSGEWHSFIWNHSKSFSLLEDFLNWLRDIPGFELKDRKQKAIWALKARLKHNSLTIAA